MAVHVVDRNEGMEIRKCPGRMKGTSNYLVFENGKLNAIGDFDTLREAREWFGKAFDTMQHRANEANYKRVVKKRSKKTKVLTAHR